MKVHVIHLIDHFVVQGPNSSHSCLVFRKLGPSIYDVLDPIPDGRFGISLLEATIHSGC